IVRETLMSAAEMGERALRLLGFRAHEAHRLTRGFLRHDETAARNLAKLWGKGDKKEFFAAARTALAETERLIKVEAGRKFGGDQAWDNEALRADAGSRGGRLRRSVAGGARAIPGAGQQRVALAGVAGQAGGAFELRAGLV